MLSQKKLNTYFIIPWNPEQTEQIWLWKIKMVIAYWVGEYSDIYIYINKKKSESYKEGEREK